MHKNSRVWIYQSNRELTEKESSDIEQKLNGFAHEWTSHSRDLVAQGKVLHNRFALLIVDESQADASGCSIDSSVHFMQDLGMEFGLDFFDRLNFAYMDNGEVKTAHRDDFSKLYAKGDINDNTIVFNNLVKDFEEMRLAWQIPLQHSWHKNFV